MGVFDDDSIVLDSEDRYGIVRRWNALIILNVFSALFNLYLSFGPTRVEGEFLWYAIGVEAFLFSIGLLAVRTWPRGIWIIGLKGIEVRRPDGHSQALAWTSVTRVLWGEELILEGEHAKIRLNWRVWPKPKAQAARRLVEKHLSRDFDLSPMPRVGEKARPILGWKFAGRIPFLSLIPLLMPAIYFAAILLSIRLDPGPGPSGLLGVWTLAYFCMLAWVVSRDRRECRRIYPDWPWRRRKSYRDLLSDL